MLEAPINEYEAERSRRIAENKAKMQNLGLIDASKSLVQTSLGANEDGALPHRYRKPNKKSKVSTGPKEPARLSKRLRGVSPPEGEKLAPLPDESDKKANDSVLGYTSKGSARKSIAEPNEKTVYCAPFTIASISTTVNALGKIYRGPWAQRYWSSSSCAYHHAYPIGYNATKHVFNRTYEMRIDAGITNPIFIVIDQQTGREFRGNSPTAPWTDICIAHNTGQRISGPLFFGFSDACTQAAIASLYNDNERIAAAAGETVQPATLSPEELAAKEFQTVEGIGEAVSIVLALTTQLGGSKHANLESLQNWVRVGDENRQQMKQFLLTSEELSSATKKWPAWKSRLVPKIIQSLSGEAINSSSSRSKRKDGAATKKKKSAAVIDVAADLAKDWGGDSLVNIKGDVAGRGDDDTRKENTNNGQNAVPTSNMDFTNSNNRCNTQ